MHENIGLRMLHKEKEISLQLADFHYVRGLSFMEHARDCRKVLPLGKWWEMSWDRTPKL